MEIVVYQRKSKKTNGCNVGKEHKRNKKQKYTIPENEGKQKHILSVHIWLYT